MPRTSSFAMLLFLLVLALGGVPAYALFGSAPLASVAVLLAAATCSKAEARSAASCGRSSTSALSLGNLAGITALSMDLAKNGASKEPEPAVQHHA